MSWGGVVRAYAIEDRPAVRAIACETAARGEPVEAFFDDREVFADLLTRYYTDWEPGSLWVAEAGGQIAGYLTGCLDGRRYLERMAWPIGPQAAMRALARGTLLHPCMRRMAAAGFRTWRLHGFDRPHLVDYPAHMHLNLLREARGQRIGERLVRRFMEQVMEARLPGIHASIRGDNERARRFFERLEFRELARYPMVLPAGEAFERHETVIYGRRV